MSKFTYTNADVEIAKKEIDRLRFNFDLAMAEIKKLRTALVECAGDFQSLTNCGTCKWANYAADSLARVQRAILESRRDK